MTSRQTATAASLRSDRVRLLHAAAGSPLRAGAVRVLYAAAALLIFVLMLLGFQQFYLHGKAYPAHPLAPPVRTLLIAHGVAMTLWVIPRDSASEANPNIFVVLHIHDDI